MPLPANEVKQLRAFLNDSSVLVRNETIIAYTKLADTGAVNDIEKLLSDSIRAVRISSAKIIEQEPENSYPYYMLGLLFNELGKNEAALKYLSQACEKSPFNLRVFYNYAVKLQQ